MAYENLVWFYRYCLPDFFQNITSMQEQITNPVQKEMMSLASAEPLHYFKGLDLIRTGGKKAVGE